MALQFLVEGARNGEPVLYITLAENRVELLSVAQSHGFSMDGVTVHEVIPEESILDPDEQYTVFHPTEVELSETNSVILGMVEKVNPSRVVVDSLSELQLLSGNPLIYRRHVLALKQYFARRSCTVLLLDDKTAIGGDQQVRSIAHGVISLRQVESDYGADRRMVRILKYRGVPFRRGAHDYAIITGGVIVYPRLVAAESRELVKRPQMSSGLASLDALLGGGIEEGSSTLVSGPPGTGKSSLAMQFVNAALAEGHQAALFLFEESLNTLLNRADGIGMTMREPYRAGRLIVHQVDPAELSPGEFAHTVRHVAEEGAKVIVIDSLNGYMNAMPSAGFLSTHLRELLTYLGQRGVVTLIIGVQSGMVGTMTSGADVSYIADNVLMLRYFELHGNVEKAISVFKKRGSAHETTLRGFKITAGGLEVGKVLEDFQGVLTGVPTLVEKGKG